MKCKNIVGLLSLAVMFHSCSYQQFGAVATGSSLGGMFGSSIGGLMGGYRGADKGTLAGMLIGGAIGAVVTSPRNNSDNARQEKELPPGDYRESHSRQTEDAYSDYGEEVTYGSYNHSDYQVPPAAHSDLEYIEVAHILFLDSNNNRGLDADEEATLVMDVYNRGSKTLYNVTPRITCADRRVHISPAATVESIPPGGGIRYKTVVRGSRRLRAGELLFSVSFGAGKQAVEARTFKVRAN